MIDHYEIHVKYPTADVVVRLDKEPNVIIDQLMGKKSVKPKQEVSRKTFKNVKFLADLSPKEQKTVLHIIDSMRRNRKE